MKVLLDSCVCGAAVSVLRSEGHDVDSVGDWSEDPGDDRILATASADGRVLVTLDSTRTLASWQSCISVHTTESYGW